MIFVCFELPDDLFVDLFVCGVGLSVRVSDFLFSIVLLYHEISRKPTFCLNPEYSRTVKMRRVLVLIRLVFPARECYIFIYESFFC